VALRDTLARGRVTAGGRFHPVPAACWRRRDLRRDFDISRGEQDELALRSHQRAVAAQASGVFAEEIVPVTVRNRKGETLVDTDEHLAPTSRLRTRTASTGARRRR